MKNTIISLVFLWTIFNLSSCNTDILPKEVDFDVSVYNNSMISTTTFHINDTVNFKFSGNPDHISFYSGEVGREYKNANRISQKSYIDTLTFTSKMDTVGKAGLLRLYISKNMKAYTQLNSKDSLSVLAANWTDISSRAVWANSTTAISSGKISLNDLAASDSMIWLAFRYTALALTLQSSWSVSALTLKHYADNTTYTILSTASMLPTSFPTYSVSGGWGIVDLLPRIGTRGWVPTGGTTGNTTLGQSLATNASTSKFTVTGSYKYINSATDMDTWIISGPIDLSRTLPDAGIQIKNYSENAMTISKGFYASRNANYTYRFTKAGVYTVTFEAVNDTRDKQKKITKSIIITVQ